MALKFKQTCFVCPEQYDVFDGKGQQVGYVRLRSGRFRVDYPNCGGETLIALSYGDGLTGCFESAEDRDEHLRMAAKAIRKKMGRTAQEEYIIE